jgi:hypothetical protein
MGDECFWEVTMRSALILIALTVALPAMAQPAGSAKVCLRQDMVNGWNVVNDKTLIVSDRVGKKFTVSLMPGCLDLKFDMRLGFKPFGGTALSCLGHNDYVLVPPGAGLPPQRCFISDVQAYNPTTPGSTAASPSK